MSEVDSLQIVIIGGGIIGCTTAYYLTNSTRNNSSTRSVKVTLIEASESGPAQGASGKAGGLVAQWAYPKELVAVSFKEHEKLAAQHGGKDRWGWRYVGCGSWEGRGDAEVFEDPKEVEFRPKKSLEKTLGLPGGSKPPLTKVRKEKGLPDDLSWVKENLTDAYSPMAKDGATAQVHPYLFTTSMFELATENGLHTIEGTAISVMKSNGRVTGVEYRNNSIGEIKTIPATHVVVAAGAWSPSIIENLPISATRAHSVVIRPQPGVHISPYVLFTEITLPSSTSDRRRVTVSPEIYARPDHEVYACGPGDNSPLPPSVDEVQVDSAACESLIKHVSSISEELRFGIVEKRQACFLPVVSTGGGPIIGEAEKIAKGLFLATGHTCWGICNAPGTARALAELILDGKIQCANLRKLLPSVIL